MGEVERADPGQLAERGGQVLEVVVRQVQALQVPQVAEGVRQLLEPVVRVGMIYYSFNQESIS